MATQSGKLTGYVSIIPQNPIVSANQNVIKCNSNQPCFSSSEVQNGGKKNMENKNEKKTYQKQGNPYKRGNTWTFIYYVTDPATGEKKQKRKGGFLSRKAAESAMKETEALIMVGRFVHDSKQTTGQYITHWFQDIHKHTLQPNTSNGYAVNIKNHIIPAIGGIPLTKLTRNDIMMFYNKLLADGLSATTIKYVNSVLRKALKEAMLSDLILKNPCDNIALPKQEKYEPTVLDSEQIKILLKRCLGTNVELEVLIALSLGLRRGETVGLMFSDFDFEQKTVHIQRQVTVVKDTTVPARKGRPVWGLKVLKTQKSNRILSVPQSVLDAVQNQMLLIENKKLKYGNQYEDNDLVCCQEDGKIESPQTVYHRFKKLLIECGLPDIRFHDLRHSYATALIDLDVPLKVISDLLGHSSIQISGDIYCHVLDKKKKQSAEIFQNAFFTT